MAMLELNLEGYEAQTGDFSPIPEGTYICVVTDSEMRTSKAGRPNLSITVTVADGEFANRKLWDNFTLNHEVGLKRLKSLATAGGHANPNFIRDSEELHGLYIKARVVTSKQEGYAAKNEIKGYSPADSNSAPSASPAATAAPAASKPSARKPWERAA